MQAIDPGQHFLDVAGGHRRAAVEQHQEVVAHGARRRRDPRSTVSAAAGRGHRPIRLSPGHAQVDSEDVDTGNRHALRRVVVIGGERSRASRPARRAARISSTSRPNDIPVASRSSRNEPVPHSPMVGKFCIPADTQLAQLPHEAVQIAERVGARICLRPPEPRSNRREHLTGQFAHDLIRVSVRKQAAERTVARVPVATGVVDDDEIRNRPLQPTPPPAPSRRMQR